MNERDVEISKREASNREENTSSVFYGKCLLHTCGGRDGMVYPFTFALDGLPVRLRRSGHDRTIYGAGSASV